MCDGGGLVAVNSVFIFLTLVYAPPTEIITVIYILFAHSMSDTYWFLFCLIRQQGVNRQTYKQTNTSMYELVY